MERPLTSLVERRLAQVITDRMAEAPVVALQGARSVGKSTLLAGIALRNDVEIIDLDDPTTQDALRSDPDRYVAAPPPVCIDEFQKVPIVLDATRPA